MIIMLTRTFTHGEYTHGHLTIDGTRICDTLENSKAQVPSGDYQISLIKCKQYARKMLLLAPERVEGESLNSLNFLNLELRCKQCKRLSFVCMNSTLPCYCPMLKPGNGVHNRLDGCIVLGVYNCVGSIIRPKVIFDALYERIRKSLSRGHEVKLSIV